MYTIYTLFNIRLIFSLNQIFIGLNHAATKANINISHLEVS